jgi:hypothetical protein
MPPTAVTSHALRITTRVPMRQISAGTARSHCAHSEVVVLSVGHAASVPSRMSMGQR